MYIHVSIDFFKKSVHHCGLTVCEFGHGTKRTILLLDTPEYMLRTVPKGLPHLNLDALALSKTRPVKPWKRALLRESRPKVDCWISVSSSFIWNGCKISVQFYFMSEFWIVLNFSLIMIHTLLFEFQLKSIEFSFYFFFPFKMLFPKVSVSGRII
jgi:hypothetical protein